MMRRYFQTIIVLLAVTVISGCKKDKTPVLSTIQVSNITTTSALCGGDITDEGSSAVISRGVCWSNETFPTVAGDKTSDGKGPGIFSSSITGLKAGTFYYVRAFATNASGTGYGAPISLTTLGQLPTVGTLAATAISATGATLNGFINANYLSSVVTFEYGKTTDYGSSVAAVPDSVTGNINTSVSANITGLDEDTTYHYRIVAVNFLGTSYGSDMTFTAVSVISENLNSNIEFFIDGKKRYNLIFSAKGQGIAEDRAYYLKKI
jgi:hypothetical protein